MSTTELFETFLQELFDRVKVELESASAIEKELKDLSGIAQLKLEFVEVMGFRGCYVPKLGRIFISRNSIYESVGTVGRWCRVYEECSRVRRKLEQVVKDYQTNLLILVESSEILRVQAPCALPNFAVYQIDAVEGLDIVNAARTISDWIYTLFHEIGHFFLNRKYERLLEYERMLYEIKEEIAEDEKLTLCKNFLLLAQPVDIIDHVLLYNIREDITFKVYCVINTIYYRSRIFPTPKVEIVYPLELIAHGLCMLNRSSIIEVVEHISGEIADIFKMGFITVKRNVEQYIDKAVGVLKMILCRAQKEARRAGREDIAVKIGRLIPMLDEVY